MIEQGGFPAVAIAGATGNLGAHVTSAFLSPQFISKFSKIVLLTRSTSSITSKFPNLDTTNNEHKNVEIREYSKDKLVTTISDVDVVINTVGSAGHVFKDSLLRAIPSCPRVRLYIPSEFGIDHTKNDFSHPEWDRKKSHFKLAQEILDSEVRVCRIYAGLFLEDSIGPWFGFNTRENKYEVVGSKDTPMTFTSLDDVGKAVAQLCTISSISDVPETLHLAGCTLTATEISCIMSAEQERRPDIKITEIDLPEYKAKILKEQTESTDPSLFLRLVMGEGRLNHGNPTTGEGGLGNDNQLLNPGQENWKWKSMEDLAKETRGRPWADVEWPPSGSVKGKH